jgi:hypothetical protein
MGTALSHPDGTATLRKCLIHLHTEPTVELLNVKIPNDKKY